jgi:hypothetical protein
LKDKVKVSSTFHSTSTVLNTTSMQNLKEVNDDIVRITLLIKSKYPELIKYLDEMPNGIPNNNRHDSEEESELKRLIEYHDSLLNLVSKYSITH